MRLEVARAYASSKLDWIRLQQGASKRRGTCNPEPGNIRLNTELVKKPRDLVE